MDVKAVQDRKTRRITHLGLHADTFEEERILAELVNAIASGDGKVIVMHGDREFYFTLNGGHEVS